MKSNALALFCKKSPFMVAAIIAVVIIAVATYMRFDLLTEHEAQLDDKKKLLARLERNIASASHLSEHVKELSEINKNISNKALKPSEIARNLQVFYQLENSVGVKFSSDVQQSVPVSVPAAAVYTRLPFKINFTADYPLVLDFFRQMEMLLAASVVTSVSLSADGAGGASRNVTISVEVLSHKF